jgi:dynein heavy chain
MTVFLDDLAMPAENKQGDQVTLEIARQLIEQQGFYILARDERGQFKEIIRLSFLAAMAQPTGGKRSIPNRLKRHFYSINMTPPSQKAIINIYGRILEALFNPKKYGPDIVAMKDLLIEGTIEVWTQVKKKLLPTPTKFHYNFTIRELSRVFGGIATVASKPDEKVIQNHLNIKDAIKPELFLIGLWRHECERTFNDKLINM